MEITSVKIQKVFDDPNKTCVAFASITIDNMIAIHDIRILNLKDKQLVAMPSKKIGDGTYKDIAHPISAEARAAVENAVLCAYSDYVSGKDSTEIENITE